MGYTHLQKSQTMHEIMSDSKLAKAASIIDEIMILANKKSKKFTMGYTETLNANQIGSSRINSIFSIN